MKRILLLTTLLLTATAIARGVTENSGTDPQDISEVGLLQETYIVPGTRISRPDRPYLPKVAAKTNALYLATTSLNVGMEFGLLYRWTIDATALYNPFQLQKRSTNQVWFVQPELRYWFCQRFERHFVGVHLIYGEYNIGQMTYLTDTFFQHRYEGTGYGAGVSWGYHLPLGGRWAMETSLGIGFIKLDEDKFACYECDDLIAQKKKNYFGPTKLGVSLVFMIR
jgi:hypothetical protein